jgi:hypothetical protein
LLLTLPAANGFDPKIESNARGLQKKAMDEDYLVNVNAAAAERDLTQALTICRDKCNPRLRAELYRDLGTVLAGMLASSRFNAAVVAFAQALNLNPNIKPDPNLATPAINAAFTTALRGPVPRIADAGGG